MLANLGRTDDTSVETQIEDTWLPVVLKRIANARPWPDLDTAGSGTLGSGETSIDLATDLRKLYNVRLDDGSNSKVIPVILPTEFDRAQHDVLEAGTTTGEPIVCCRYGRALRFSPTSDDDYTISYRYRKVVGEMDDDTDTCDILDIDDILIAELTQYACLQLRRFELAAVWQRKAKEAWEAHDSDIGGSPPLIRPYTASAYNDSIDARHYR